MLVIAYKKIITYFNISGYRKHIDRFYLLLFLPRDKYWNLALRTNLLPTDNFDEWQEWSAWRTS